MDLDVGYSFKMNELMVPRMARSKSFAMVAALLAAAASPAIAQVNTGLATQVRPAAPAVRPPVQPRPATGQVTPEAPVPGNPDFAPQPVSPTTPAPAPIPLPPPMWDAVSAQDLLYYIQQIGKEGLNPDDYDPAGLAAALQAGNPVMLSQVATDRFNRLSSDLALGHVKKPARIDWWVVDKDL